MYILGKGTTSKLNKFFQRKRSIENVFRMYAFRRTDRKPINIYIGIFNKRKKTSEASYNE